MSKALTPVFFHWRPGRSCWMEISRGAATAGVYQTRTSELLDSMGDQNTLGLQAPAGGTLIIGAHPQPGISNDTIACSIPWSCSPWWRLCPPHSVPVTNPMTRMRRAHVSLHPKTERGGFEQPANRRQHHSHSHGGCQYFIEPGSNSVPGSKGDRFLWKNQRPIRPKHQSVRYR